MAWTQEDLDNLETAIASGERRVEFADKVTEYRSLNEMLRVRTLIRRGLGLEGTGKVWHASHDRGTAP